MLEDDFYVYKYTVYWKDDYNLTHNTWYMKLFALKDDAIRFAKKYKSKDIKLKPYIIKTITIRRTFKKDIEVEKVPEKVLNKYSVVGSITEFKKIIKI